MPSGRRKLLLADDSPTIRKVVSLTFGDEGLEVVAVGDGEAALRALSGEPPPDVLLADVVMPGPDGYELCERVKRDARLSHVPVVLLVGTFEPFNEAEARRVGADTVLTKPFQSIRDLVSKVGSLLGGGGDAPRREEDGAARTAGEGRAPDAAPPRPEARARGDEDARAVAAEESRRAEPDSSFADLGADDELIEARPADAYGSAAGSRREAESEPAFAETLEPGFLATSQRDEGGFAAAAAAAPAEGFASGADAFAGWDEERAVSRTPESQTEQTEQTEETPMHETTPPRTSPGARAESAAAADDTLLDLGRADAHAASAGAQADEDDFVLDLDLGDDTPARAASAAAADVLDEPAREPVHAWADAPSAFAEAAHGESASTRAEAAPSFESSTSFDSSLFDSSSFDSSSTSFERSSPSLEAAGEPWRDVVVQDGPQGFAFGGEEPQALGASPQGFGSAPRGFVEPEVVPADEPMPATVASEFTDGRVEGDVPRPPASQTSPVEAPAQQPSAAGFSVGEARAGVEESPRAGRLSQEELDAIARRVVEMMSDKVIREIAWEVVPELAELLIRRKLEEERMQ